MGEIIKRYTVRAGDAGRGISLRLFFDSGSPRTFVKESVAARLGRVFKLENPRPFGGLGNGAFQATGLIELSIHFLDVWCPHPTYVVQDEVLEPHYDILVGHDVMQTFDIHLRPKEHQVRLDRERLRTALRVRSPIELPDRREARARPRRSARR